MLTKRLINFSTTTTSTRQFTVVINSIPNFKLPALPCTDKVSTKLLTPYQEDGTFFDLHNDDKEAKYLIKQLFPLYKKPYFDPSIKPETLEDITWFPEEFKLTVNDIQTIDNILAQQGSNSSQDLYNELKSKYGTFSNFGLVINYTIFHFNELSFTSELIALYLGDMQNSEIGFDSSVNSYCFGNWLKCYVRSDEFHKALALHEAALYFDIPQTPLYTKYLTLALANDGKLEESWELLRQLEQAKVELSQSYYLTLFEHSNAFENSKFSIHIWKRMLTLFRMTNPQSKDRLNSKAYQLRLENITKFEELETLMRWITTRKLWNSDDLKLKFLKTFQRINNQQVGEGESEPNNLKYEFVKFNNEQNPIYLLNGWLNYHINNQPPSDNFKFIEFIYTLTEIASASKINAFLIEIVNNNLERIGKLKVEEQTAIVYSTLKCLKQNPNTYHSGWLSKYKGLLLKFKDLNLEEELKLKVELLIKQ